MRQQLPAVAVSARLGHHEQIFEVDAGLREERRVVLEEQREADRRASVVADEHFGRRTRTKQRRAQFLFGRDDVVAEPFVLREPLDHPQDHGHVALGRRFDSQGGLCHIHCSLVPLADLSMTVCSRLRCVSSFFALMMKNVASFW